MCSTDQVICSKNKRGCRIFRIVESDNQTCHQSLIYKSHSWEGEQLVQVHVIGLDCLQAQSRPARQSRQGQPQLRMASGERREGICIFERRPEIAGNCIYATFKALLNCNLINSYSSSSNSSSNSSESSELSSESSTSGGISGSVS